MPDIYDQDLEGLAAAEETQTQEAEAAVKTTDKPRGQVVEAKATTEL